MVVGITGGIGSGKSTIVKKFSELGNIAIYNADVEAKKIMNTSSIVKSKLISLFGKDSYLKGQLNRKFISNIVFSDKEKLHALNAIVHPEVYKHLKAFININVSKDYILYENAILFENKSDSFCDFIITVSSSVSSRIERVIVRDGVSKEEVLNRINKQWSDNKKCLLSNYIIVNEDFNKLDSQIFRIHNNLTKNIHSI